MTKASDTPDTTVAVDDAVEAAIEHYALSGYVHGSCYCRPDSEAVAHAALKADRAELDRLGYEIVKRGSVPSWMSEERTCGCNDSERVYRLASNTPKTEEGGE